MLELASDRMDEFRALQDDTKAREALVKEYLDERTIRRSGLRIGQKTQAAIFASATQDIKSIVSNLLFSSMSRKKLTRFITSSLKLPGKFLSKASRVCSGRAPTSMSHPIGSSQTRLSKTTCQLRQDGYGIHTLLAPDWRPLCSLGVQ